MAVNKFTRVCVDCEVEMRCKQNGVCLVEAATWGFMNLYQADLWHCPYCEHETIIGVADTPEYSHWENHGDIASEVKRREERGQRVVLCWLNAKEREEFMRRAAEATHA